MSRAELAQSLADELQATRYAELRGVTMAGSGEQAGKANELVFRLWRNRDLLIEVLNEKGPALPDKPEPVWWPIPTVLVAVITFFGTAWMFSG